MAFDDLDQAEQEESNAATDEEAAARDAPTADGAASSGGTSPSNAEANTSSGSDGGAADARDAEAAPATDPAAPAFGFDEAKQRPLYARQEAWDAFEDALAIEVEATLRRNDVRDTPKRELHDAALHVLADHAEEVAERVLAERGVDQ